VPIPATFTASRLRLMGKILMTSEDGDTFVIKLDPNTKYSDEHVGEPVYASPALLMETSLFVGKGLYCIAC